MVHITALALFHAAPPPGFPGAMAWSPPHACAPDIMGNSRLRPPGPRPTRPPVDSETTPHMEERLAPVLPLLFLFFLFL